MKIFVPLLNGNIHGYTIGGKPLKSWNPRLSGGVASQPLLCGYDGIGKFWLAQLSDNGQLQVWDSLGQNVFQAVETGKIHPGKVQLLKDSAGNPSWMFCSEEQVFSCAFNGSVRIWETADTNLCLNITEKDGRMVLLLSGRGNIRRYSGDWEFEDVMKTSNQETAETDTLSLNGKNLILINDQVNRKLSVYDPEFRAALLKDIQYGLFPVLSSRLFAGQLIMIESDAQKGIGARRLH